MKQLSTSLRACQPLGFVHSGTVVVRTDSPAFQAFENRLEDDLERLILQWIDQSAPCDTGRMRYGEFGQR